MDKKVILKFGDTEIEKRNKFYYLANSNSIYDADINKRMVSKKISFGKKCFKYFVGYIDDQQV